MQQQTKGSTGVLRGYGALTDSSRTLEMGMANQAVQPQSMDATRVAQARAGIARLSMRFEYRERYGLCIIMPVYLACPLRCPVRRSVRIGGDSSPGSGGLIQHHQRHGHPHGSAVRDQQQHAYGSQLRQ